MRRLLPALAMLLLAAAPAAAVPPTAAEHFDHAYAFPTCAPWDGGAWEVVIQTQKVGPIGKDGLPAPRFPSYDFRLWQRQPPTGRWLSFDEKIAGQPIGSLSERRSAAAVRNVAGKVFLKRCDDRGIAGELRLARPGGGELVLPFDAPKLKLQVLCG